MRSAYAVSIEEEAFRKFLAGEPYDLSWMDDWLETVRAATSEGKQFQRVRVVDEPMSDYARWSLEVAQHNNAAGEDIRYLQRERARAAGLPNHDYWLFDSRLLVRMDYDDCDQFLGGTIIEDPAEVVQHNYWRDVAWHHAVRRDEFAADERSGRA
ncbi:MAG: hypothetical protein DIU77_013920 [Thermocrispum agreste]|uniref:DUF6879 domain-containing protein n=1 Tax=Thermocrispum agreste TaxID=37925 RepID=A0ABD6FJ43_9PSEU